MRIVNKLIVISVVIMFLLVIFQSGVLASNWNPSETVNSIFEKKGEGEAVNSIELIAGTVITIAKVITTGVAIIMLIVLAMKYMLSAPEDRATIKKHAVVYIVGAVILFGATGILSIIENFAVEFNK